MESIVLRKKQSHTFKIIQCHQPLIRLRGLDCCIPWVGWEWLSNTLKLLTSLTLISLPKFVSPTLCIDMHNSDPIVYGQLSYSQFIGIFRTTWKISCFLKKQLDTLYIVWCPKPSIRPRALDCHIPYWWQALWEWLSSTSKLMTLFTLISWTPTHLSWND